MKHTAVRVLLLKVTSGCCPCHLSPPWFIIRQAAVLLGTQTTFKYSSSQIQYSLKEGRVASVNPKNSFNAQTCTIAAFCRTKMDRNGRKVPIEETKTPAGQSC